MNFAQVLEHHQKLHAARTERLRRIMTMARPQFERALERGAEKHGIPASELLILVCSKGRECPVKVSTVPLSEAMALLSEHRAQHISKTMRAGVMRVFAWLQDGFSKTFFVYPDDEITAAVLAERESLSRGGFLTTTTVDAADGARVDMIL